MYFHNFKNILLISIFSLYLFLPTVYVAISLIQTSGSESGRILFKEVVSLPLFQELDKKKNLLQNWMDESLGIRNTIIKNFNYAYWRYFGLSIYPQEVIIGRGGWFFQGKESFDQYTGAKLLSSSELENWVGVMEARQEWLAAQGIQFYIVFAPTKYFVYPEKIPFWVRKAEYTSIDQLFDRLSASTLKYYNGLDALQDKKEKHRVYTTADIHWTDSGAWFVFEEIKKELIKLFPETVDWPNVSISNFKQFAANTYYCGMQRKLLKFDDLVSCPWERPILEGGSKYTFSGEDAWKYKGKEDKNVSIWPNNTTLTVQNLNSNNEIKALVIGNSFTGAMSRYFNRLFSEISYDFTYRANGKQFEKKVEEEKPDIVIIVTHYSGISKQILFGPKHW